MYIMFKSLSPPQRPLCFFFVRTGKWGEVKSKREQPGENRNESARGTLGREKEKREDNVRFSGQICGSVVIP